MLSGAVDDMMQIDADDPRALALGGMRDGCRWRRARISQDAD